MTVASDDIPIPIPWLKGVRIRICGTIPTNSIDQSVLLGETK